MQGSAQGMSPPLRLTSRKQTVTLASRPGRRRARRQGLAQKCNQVALVPVTPIILALRRALAPAGAKQCSVPANRQVPKCHHSSAQLSAQPQRG